MEDYENMSNPRPYSRLPALPRLARIPWAWTPGPLKNGSVAAALNALFAHALRQGELDFLDRRTMNVGVTDAGVEFSVGLNNGALRVSQPAAVPDLSIEGTVYTFLQLASREEDADTLFFRRQLRTSGDTELGLCVKNFLDGLDPETLPYYRVVDPLLHAGLRALAQFEQTRLRVSGLAAAAPSLRSRFPVHL